jgi:integrase
VSSTFLGFLGCCGKAHLSNRSQRAFSSVFYEFGELMWAAISVSFQPRSRVIKDKAWPLGEYLHHVLRRHFAKAKQLAGLHRRFRFHDLRHTSGSKMASAGVPLQIIAKVLGHSSVAMSERYARPDAASMQQVAAAMERK